MDKSLDIKEIFLKKASIEGKGEKYILCLLTSNSGFPRGRFLLSNDASFNFSLFGGSLKVNGFRKRRVSYL